MQEFSFADFAVGAFALKLIYALAAIVALFVVLRWFDRRAARGQWAVGLLLKSSAESAAIYYGLRFVGAALLFGLLMGCSAANAAPLQVTDRYDAAIERAVQRYWPDLPAPMLWKAQLWQESRLRPEAVSPAGARGLAQFMPGTWREAVRTLGLGVASPHDDVAIEAGAWYQAKMRAVWRARDRTALERHALGLASYNAGIGNVIKAQRLCANGRLWPEVAPCLRLVTGDRNARETTGYVELILGRWWPMLEAMR